MTVRPDSKTQTQGLVPIVIGITGHRDLREEDKTPLYRKILDIFREIKDKYPLCPLVVLSSLAEGADRLGAKAALECGAKLIVPLPMSKEEYEKDFNTPLSHEKFNDLLNRAERHFTLPLPEGSTEDNIKYPGIFRNNQYLQVGAYIARNSQILIALWDGKTTDLTGGTSQVVRFKLEGVPTPYSPPRQPLDIEERGPVYHILTPRMSHAEIEGIPYTSRKLYPRGWQSDFTAEKTYDRIFSSMAAFNRDALYFRIKMPKIILKNRGFVIPDDKLEMIPSSSRNILECFAVADTMAQNFKKRCTQTWLNIFTLVLLGFLFLQAYIELYSHLFFLSLFPFLLGLALLFHHLARRGDYQDKFLEYRALAEGLRVQFFWNIFPLREAAPNAVYSTEEVSTHYLSKHFNELEWIRNAIRGLNIPLCDESAPTREDHLKKGHEIVLTQWIKDQMIFYIKRAGDFKSEVDKKERCSDGLFWMGIGLAVAVIILHSYLEHVALLRHLMLFLVAASIAFSASVKGYIDKMSFLEISKQYARMADIFSRAFALLQPSPSTDSEKEISPETRKAVIFQLGKEALAENGDWVLLHRSKPIEVPRSG